jgi:hypothetical protein
MITEPRIGVVDLTDRCFQGAPGRLDRFGESDADAALGHEEVGYR